MPLGQMKDAVARQNTVDLGGNLEATYGVSLHTVRAIAETGVDRISVGALMRSAKVLDDIG
jgi:nicotinate-nucleotide pyrophosphorylase (carboxylating)